MIDETARVAARRQCMPQRTTDHIRHHLTHRVPPHATTHVTPPASTVLVTVERRLTATRTTLCESSSPPSLPGWEHASRASGLNDSYRRDSGTRRLGDSETRRLGDSETRRLGDTETRGPGDPETRRHGDTETRRHGDAGIRPVRASAPRITRNGDLGRAVCARRARTGTSPEESRRGEDFSSS